MKLPHSRTVGTFYIVFAILAGLVGVGLSLVIRLDISSPDIIQHILPQFWLSFASSGHALMMVVFMMIPALFGGFGNWLIPMMIGTDDMQFRWLNMLAFALLPVGFLALMTGLLSSSTPFINRFWLIMSLHIIAVSFILNAINFIATILVARPPGMRLRNMPPFVWSLLVASFLMVTAVPIMTATLTLKLGEFDGETKLAAMPVMMWFFAQPQLFVLLLPAFGIISQVIATFANGRLIMERMVNGAFVMMGVIGFLFWSETILANAPPSHTDEFYQNYFFIALPLMALPVACIIISWLCTLWYSQRRWQVPMLWALGFISMLLVAALSAINLAGSGSLAIGDFLGHFHYILGLSSVFAIFAGWYFWFGKISRYQISNLSGQLHFWTMFIAVHLTFLPQHFGTAVHAPDSWGFFIDTIIGWQNLATLGACFSALSLLIFFYAIIEAFIRKRPAVANPWGAGAIGLEWQLALSAQSQDNALLIPVKNSP